MNKDQQHQAITRLHLAINAITPIHGVSIGDWDKPSTWRVDYIGVPTMEERIAVVAALDHFDPLPQMQGET